MRLYNRCRLRGKYLEIKMLKMEILLKILKNSVKFSKFLKKLKLLLQIRLKFPFWISALDFGIFRITAEMNEIEAICFVYNYQCER